MPTINHYKLDDCEFYALCDQLEELDKSIEVRRFANEAKSGDNLVLPDLELDQMLVQSCAMHRVVSSEGGADRLNMIRRIRAYE